MVSLSWIITFVKKQSNSMWFFTFNWKFYQGYFEDIVTVQQIIYKNVTSFKEWYTVYKCNSIQRMIYR